MKARLPTFFLSFRGASEAREPGIQTRMFVFLDSGQPLRGFRNDRDGFGTQP